jgi:hypothetical protein
LHHNERVPGVAFASGTRTVATSSQGYIRLWTIPPPAEGDSEQIRSWVYVLTGLELMDGGIMQGRMNVERWQQSRNELLRLGILPLP